MNIIAVRLLLILPLLAFSTFALAAPATVFGPKSFAASPSTTVSNQSFTNTLNNADGVLTVVNGDGRDLTAEVCPKNPLLSRFSCELRNVERLIIVTLFRPTQIEVSLNSQVLVTSVQLPPRIGKYQVPVKVNLSNSLTVKVKGLWTSSITVDVKANSVVPNLPPVARFSYSPNSGIAPELFTLSALASSDSDGTIASYDWDFGDGQFATGSLVMHNFVNAGTYAVKLKVTDNQGATNTISQNILVNANQLPTANFVALVSAVDGILNLSVDATGSADSDGSLVEMRWNFGDQSAEFVGAPVQVTQVSHIYAQGGTYTVTLTVKDNKGGLGSKVLTINVVDQIPPVIAVVSPTAGAALPSASVSVSGNSNEKLSSVTAQLASGSVLALNLSADGKSFSGTLTASVSGTQTLTVIAKDLAGNSTTTIVNFSAQVIFPPIASLRVTIPPSKVVPLMVLFDASASSSPQGNPLHFEFNFGDGQTAQSQSGIISHQYVVAGSYSATVRVLDNSNIYSEAQVQITAIDAEVAPIVDLLAPPLLDSRPQTMAEKVSFLYQGPDAIQKNVLQGAIDEARLSILHGSVRDENDQPISGVRIRILETPEVGETSTNNNGQFFIAANGGGTLTVTYERNGYFPVQRKVQTSALDYFVADPVIMTKANEVVTQVALNSSQQQIVQPPVVVDQSGSRSSVLILPAGTQAHLLMPDGSTKNISTLSFRSSEYTVGANGPKKMPGPLPPTTRYIYAVELSADEAIANGADHVVFSNPVPYYVENFLGMPTGVAVPFGTFNAKLGAWEAEEDGVVLKILSIQNGKAILSMDTTEVAASAAQLAQVQITDDELSLLGQKFSSGQSFWRVQVKHLSPLDLNWLDSIFGIFASATKATTGIANDEKCKALVNNACVINISQQTLEETIEMNGIPSDLHYNSLTKPGRLLENIVSVPLFVGNPPVDGSVKKVLLRIEVAGQVFEQEYLPSPDLAVRWQWDGKDAFGRAVQGSTNARVTVTYQGDRFYQVGRYIVGAKSFTSAVKDAIPSSIPVRELSSYTRVFDTPVGAPQYKNWTDIGGWNFEQIHTYSPVSKTLYLGNGTTIDAKNMAPIVSLVAGSPNTAGFKGDGASATTALFGSRISIAVGPDSSIYIGDPSNYRIRKITPDGIINTIAGTGVFGVPTDGVPAISSRILDVSGLAVSGNGTVYFTDSGTHHIWKINPNDGILHLVAGSGNSGFSGDGGPATLANVVSPYDILVTDDGTIYFSDSNAHRIRKISPDGIISTVAGNGTSGSLGDGGNALQASFQGPDRLAIGLNGEIYITDSAAHKVRVVFPNGTIQTFAGTGVSGSSGNENLATLAQMRAPTGVYVAPDGTVYIGDYGSSQLRIVTTDGKIHSNIADGTLFILTASSGASSFPLTAIGPNFIRSYKGMLLFASSFSIHLLHDALPAKNDTGYSIASVDATDIYQFSPEGVHLQTLFAKTGKVKWAYTYNAQGRLVSFKDANNNITNISRNADGTPNSITGPFGQNFTFSNNPDGYISSATNPSGETSTMTYQAGGLMTQFKKPKGNGSTYEYNSIGELVKDTDAGGGIRIMSRSFDNKSSSKVDHVSPEGRRTTAIAGAVGSSPFISANLYQTITPDGVDTQQFNAKNSNYNTVYADNWNTYLEKYLEMSYPPSLDPRLGGITQFYTADDVYVGLSNTPIIRSIKRSSSYFPLSSTDFFKYLQTDTVSNGTSVVSRTYDGALKQETIKTGLGRVIVSQLDDQERIISTSVGDLAPTFFQYNSRGQLSSFQQGDRVTTMSYDSLGQLATMTDAEGNISSYSRDLSGRLTQLTRPDLSIIKYGYDLNGNLSSLQPPDKLIHILVANILDLFSAYTPPTVAGGGSTTYSYNRDQQLTKITRPDGGATSFIYDPVKAQLNRIQGFQKSIDYVWSHVDSISIPTKTTSSDGVVIDTAFFTREYPSSRTYSGNTLSANLTYSWISGLLLNSWSINGSPVIISYDNDHMTKSVGDLILQRDVETGLVTSSLLASTNETYSYNSFGELVQSGASYGGSPFFSNQYTRDKLGRITSKQESILGENKIYSYVYDQAGRLSSVSINDSTTSQYSYDKNGNRLSYNGLTGTYDNQDRLTQFGSTQYFYDSAGNLIKKQTATDNTLFVYDDFGQLSSASLPGGKSITYLVDGEMRRSVKMVNGATIRKLVYHANGQIAAELNSDNSLKSVFIYGTQDHSPDYLVQGTNRYRLIKDHLGSVRLVVNSDTGNVVQRLDYDEFGKVLSDSNPNFQPFAFAGGLYDSDTKLVQFAARAYDPEVGRWTSKDPIFFNGGDSNLYGYTLQDPINRIDPEGKSPFGTGAALLCAAFDLYTYYSTSHAISQYQQQILDINTQIRSLDAYSDCDKINKLTLQSIKISADLARAQRENGSTLAIGAICIGLSKL